jgi:hypothetical protein
MGDAEKLGKYFENMMVALVSLIFLLNEIMCLYEIYSECIITFCQTEVKLSNT